MKIKKKRNFKTQRIELSHSDFTFSPDKITPETFAKSKKVPIQITCNTTFTQDQVVELKTENGEMVGAIAFMENEVKKISVQPIYVIDNTTDWGKIEKYTKNELLQQYFLRAFSSPLIEVSIKDPFKLSLLESNYSKSPSLRYYKRN